MNRLLRRGPGFLSVLFYRQSREGRGQPGGLLRGRQSGPQVNTGEINVQINTAVRKRGMLKYDWGVWSLKRCKHLQNSLGQWLSKHDLRTRGSSIARNCAKETGPTQTRSIRHSGAAQQPVITGSTGDSDACKHVRSGHNSATSGV